MKISFMAVRRAKRATGAEIREFYENHFPAGYYHLEQDGKIKLTDFDGNWILDDNTLYDLSKIGPCAKMAPPRFFSFIQDPSLEIPFETAFIEAMRARGETKVLVTAKSPEELGRLVDWLRTNGFDFEEL
jgi:hypothetical protein